MNVSDKLDDITPPKITNAKGSTHILINSEAGTENISITLAPNHKLVLYVAHVAENDVS